MSIIIESYENWQKSQGACQKILEFPLFTDASNLIGQIDKAEDCPYEILNTLVLSRENIFLPRLVLRVYLHLDNLYTADEYDFYILNTDDASEPATDKKAIVFYKQQENQYKVKVWGGRNWLNEKGSYIDNPSLENVKRNQENGLVEKTDEIKNIIVNVIIFQGLNEVYSDIQIQEQIAALLSLVYGIRLKAGALSREIDPHGVNFGVPVSYEVYKNPFSAKFISSNNLILPSAVLATPSNNHLNINCNMKIFYKFPHLKKEDALALLRASKLYSDALMMVESEPSLAWLMMISAVEVVAEQWRITLGIKKDLSELKDKKSDIVDLIVTHCNSAKGNPKKDKEYRITNTKGVDIKFYIFILSHFPEPPSKRPEGSFSIGFDSKKLKGGGIGDWNPETILKCLKEIYKHRCRALHGGIPFPRLMCQSPLVRLQSGEILAERSPCVALDGNAIYFSTFEYIVRTSLLKWWDQLPGNYYNQGL